MLLSLAAVAEEPEFKKSLYYRGVTFHHLVTETAHVDLDGDGSVETVVGYRQPGDAVGLSGGLLVLSERAAGLRVAWHAFFKGFYPRKISVSGRRLDIEMLETGTGGDQTFQQSLEHGKNFFFRWEEGSPLYGVKIKASSSLRKEPHPPENVFDGDLRTAWAEGAEGTGAGETLTFEFARPVDMGLIGMLPGNVRSRRDWQDNNRVHRADVTVETHSDRFDAATDVDLDRDLGLGVYGDMVELEFTNKPILSYFSLEKKEVVSLEIKIASVLLGERNDDTYVAEVDFAEMYTREQLERPASPPAPATEKKAEKAEKEGTGGASPTQPESDEEGF